MKKVLVSLINESGYSDCIFCHFRNKDAEECLEGCPQCEPGRFYHVVYNKPKVFLAGSWEDHGWRDKLIPMLDCEYYNPVQEEWKPEDQLIEVHQKKVCDYVLYVFYPDKTALLNLVQMVESLYKTPEKTIVCMLEDGDSDLNMVRLTAAALQAAMPEGGTIFTSLDEVAECINSK